MAQTLFASEKCGGAGTGGLNQEPGAKNQDKSVATEQTKVISLCSLFLASESKKKFINNVKQKYHEINCSAKL